MDKKTFIFQTEIKQILDIVINSLYKNKEIFIRELISNASDAIDKLKFEALKNQKLFEDAYDLNIKITIDKNEKTITVTDNGIGMSYDEIIENLGTIAKSGTKEFLKNVTKTEQETSQLIGKFGVGFYSTFMVADKVVVKSRKAGLPAKKAVIWESTGSGNYTVTNIEKKERGTEIIVYIKENEHTLLNHWKIKKIINTYSDHISIPILMLNENSTQTETVNKAVALWALPKNEITKKQYYEFYKHLTNDTQNPLIYTHNKVEGTLNYTNLLFIPQKFPYELNFTEKTAGLKLYIQRIFILDNATQFLPNYFRFIKGIIDSNDLPLNVSRETIQESSNTTALKTAITNKVFTMLDELEKDTTKYNQFWLEFGKILKEGPAEDYVRKEKIAKYFRFTILHNDTKTENLPLTEYIGKMKNNQQEIYYLSVNSYKDVDSNPYLEIFKKKNIPVLLFFEKIDEWLITHLAEFNNKKFKSILKSNLNIPENNLVKNNTDSSTTTNNDTLLINKIKNVLKTDIKDVKISERLINAPSCVVIDDYDMTPQMERLLKQAGKNVVQTKPILEINKNHTLIKKLEKETDDNKIKILSNIIFKQALLAEGGQIENPSLFIEEMNSLL